MAETPDFLKDFLATSRPEPKPYTGLLPAISNGSGTAYGKTALAGEIAKVLAAEVHTRNDTLNRSAFKIGQLVSSGHIQEVEAIAQLTSAAATVGLSASEIAGTVRSGMGSGQGYPREPESLPVNVIEVDEGEFGEATEGASETSRERTSWWPRPIGERASEAAEAPLPTHLTRDDGNCLLYAGKVNGIIGESESGKSWVALLAVMQAVGRGERVLFLDFEDSPASVYRRFEYLQATSEEIALVDYADPQESLELEQRADLNEALGNNYGLIVADGVNAAMVLLDLDLNSNTDATKFFRRLLRPLARTGACVITVDHLPKNPDARGKGGIGAQAKRAMTDGCLLTADVVEPFGVGQSGSVKLGVDKDRSGRVRGISASGKKAGVMQITSISDVVELVIEASVPVETKAGETVDWRPTWAMEQVSRWLEQAGKPLSFRGIEQGVGARESTIRMAIKALRIDGHLTTEPGPRNANMHILERPYRENEDDRPTVSQVSPTVLPGDGRLSVSTVSPVPPLSGGHETVGHSQPATDNPEFEFERLQDGWSSCNRCGDPTPDDVIEDTAGYCRPCGRIMNP